MTSQQHTAKYPDHDWHSPDYVDGWIARDVAQDAARRPRLAHMLSFAPYSPADAITVLDIGCGYGIVAEEVLKAFPRARVTLQDYSEPMFAHARRRLAGHAARIETAICDFGRPGWAAKVGGPFDLAVSGKAIHNLRDMALISDCYRAIPGLLGAGGWFLDYDLFDVAGGLDRHVAALRGAGFEAVDCVWHEAPNAIVTARRA